MQNWRSVFAKNICIGLSCIGIELTSEWEWQWRERCSEIRSARRRGGGRATALSHVVPSWRSAHGSARDMNRPTVIFEY